MAKPPPGAPWAPVPLPPDIIATVRMMAQGADSPLPHQCQRFLDWLVRECCAAYDVSYRPDSDRDTAFAEGKRFVGLTIVKASKADPSQYKEYP